MQWLRATIFNLGMVLNTIVFSSLTVLLAPLPAVLHSRIASGWAYVAMGWLALTCGLRYRVIGAENIPEHACVILSKHQSAWETIAFQVIFPPGWRCIAKPLSSLSRTMPVNSGAAMLISKLPA